MSPAAITTGSWTDAGTRPGEGITADGVGVEAALAGRIIGSIAYETTNATSNNARLIRSEAAFNFRVCKM